MIVGSSGGSLYATDFETGESIAQHEGKLVDALRASVAVPYIWPAWPHNGRTLIDGAASNPLPVDVPIREGVDIILAMGFESPCQAGSNLSVVMLFISTA